MSFPGPAALRFAPASPRRPASHPSSISKKAGSPKYHPRRTAFQAFIYWLSVLLFKKLGDAERNQDAAR